MLSNCTKARRRSGKQPNIETKRNAENNIIKIWIKFVGFKQIKRKIFYNIILGSSKEFVGG